MPSNRSVAGIGEVLMDLFENGQATVGGAPFNVIFHIHQLLQALSMGEGIFLSAVGVDPWGRHIRSTMAAAGMTSRFLAEVQRPTGTALVFESGGGAGFEIQPDVAWDAIELDETHLELARNCDAAVFGTLAQRSDVSRSSIQRFVAQVKGPRLYDVNLRRNTNSGVAGYSAEIVAESLRLATVVKMNDAELAEVAALVGLPAESEEQADPAGPIFATMDRLCREFSLNAVAITRGSKGALLASGGKHLRLPDSSLDQAQVHAVGAGDSFAAGLLFGVIEGWAPEECLEVANLLSSYVVRQTSATPPLPHDVLAKLRALAEKARAAKTP